MVNWFSALVDSKIYLAIFTENFLKDAKCYAQWETAKELKKPFRIFRKKGVDIPIDWLEGIEDIKIVEYECFDEIHSKITKEWLID